MGKQVKINSERNRITTKLPLGSMVKLGQELESVLKFPLTVNAKYYLTKLAWEVNIHSEAYNTENNKLVRTLGIVDENTGGFRIPVSIKDDDGNDIANPKYIEYQDKMGDFSRQIVSIKHDEILLEDLGDNSTDMNFPALFKVILR